MKSIQKLKFLIATMRKRVLLNVLIKFSHSWVSTNHNIKLMIIVLVVVIDDIWMKKKPVRITANSFKVRTFLSLPKFKVPGTGNKVNKGGKQESIKVSHGRWNLLVLNWFPDSPIYRLYNYLTLVTCIVFTILVDFTYYIKFNSNK